ncbi:MAG: tRNA-dihydrouridine synthase 3 [Piccolia ochrophora]|nr:MAG: tRNA-dihydrouridine synthase 3 [Piccolia ochrophora]
MTLPHPSKPELGGNSTAGVAPLNPLDNSQNLLPPAVPKPEQVPSSEPDSTVTRAEYYEQDGLPTEAAHDDARPSKRIKLLDAEPSAPTADVKPERAKGVASIKSEYLLNSPGSKQQSTTRSTTVDDDAAEASHHTEREGDKSTEKKRAKANGQNTNRKYGLPRDSIQLCASRSTYPEFSPENCKFGDSCKFEHNLRNYLKNGKRQDVATFGGVCPVWDVLGLCPYGWKCRFLGSHMDEKETESGKWELVLKEDQSRKNRVHHTGTDEGAGDIANVLTTQQKSSLSKRKVKTDSADKYLAWMDVNLKELNKELHTKRQQNSNDLDHHEDGEDDEAAMVRQKTALEDRRAEYTEPPLRPSEKRKLYFGPETPILAPLTTQGNLPFRRLCVDLGAQATYSEMAMSLPLLQGSKSEWALMKVHESETTPPALRGKESVVAGYDNSKDLKFGAQIAASKAWQALKATEVLTSLCPQLRVVDLNCGCPIDLVYRTGAGSAMLDSPGKMEKIIRGMNAVSGEVPVTAKIRMGTKDGKPTALKLVERLACGGREAYEAGDGPSGVAALTLHGRSRQQRYTRSADWQYIADCATLIQRLNEERDRLTDTTHDVDPRDQPSGRGGKLYFLGNGDCYSHFDYYNQLDKTKVDSVMIARGALMKPWIFEEIETQQYLDKTATERLAYIEKFAKYGLETWGSDEMGLGTTRRFLMEWLSFTHRYVPLGILEYLPPRIQDRAPAWRGRNELENLLASDNCNDWLRISEMFLGPAGKDFYFQPKHKSHSYEIQAEG